MASASNRPTPGKRPFEENNSPDYIDKEGNGEDAGEKLFNDPVHGFIELHPLLVKIVHTPEFQRLKDIKQLGLCYWVFPGASHNRFEHSLGTAHLCGKLIDMLHAQHLNEIEITDKERLCIRIAGLCHDLGHGPFSHFFDGVYIPRAKPGCQWCHEDASCAMLDFMLEKHPDLNEAFRKHDLDVEEKSFIKELIRGKDPRNDSIERMCGVTGKPKWFLYEIVSNKRNGIDCDKFDYFARDCLNIGMKSNFDWRRYFEHVRVIAVDNQLQICIREKEVFNVYELFYTRWSLHHRVYRHKTLAAIQHLLAEALLKVDRRLQISDAMSDMRRYAQLTDSIIYKILRNKSDDEDVKEARALIHRIQRRQLYKFCGQTRQTDPDRGCPSEADIAREMALLSNGKLDEGRILVSIVDIYLGMVQGDPMDNVVFFNKSYEPLKFRKEQVSQLLPKKFHDRFIRVYAKSPEDTEAVQSSFGIWCQEHKHQVPHALDGDPTGYFFPGVQGGRILAK